MHRISDRVEKSFARFGKTNLGSWLMTVDHKRIGIFYMVTAFLFFIIAGIFALFMRLQLAQPNGTILDSTTYNQIFTMHGTTMIFLVVMPLSAGLGNYLVPLMLGARDMAYPKMNALSYWTFLAGGLMLYSSFFLGGAPDAGWFSYAPLTEKAYSINNGMTFWGLSILLIALASTFGSINFIVTTIQLRAKGMSFLRMPLFVWMTLVTSFLGLFAIPSLTTASSLLLLDRLAGAHFLNTAAGGDALLWQHLFWFFGHPEVYIMILPAFGIVSEVIPVFSGKPLFGYKAIVLSGIAIGILGFTVWGHHMFATGLPETALLVFSADSFLIGVPTGIKIFSWIGTMWGGKLRFTSPMLFAVGEVALFTIGGIDGIHMAILPLDWQLTDTYYVVSHIHYVLFGGAIFGLFAGLYYWFPKITGRTLSESIGKWQFWTMFVGMNLVFFPMHVLGLLGMPRRIYTYSDAYGWGNWNLIMTIGAFIVAIAVLLFVINFFITIRKPVGAKDDPWDANTLEWATSSPPPAYNFETLPAVNSTRPLWDLKHPGMGEAEG